MMTKTGWLALRQSSTYLWSGPRRARPGDLPPGTCSERRSCTRGRAAAGWAGGRHLPPLRSARSASPGWLLTWNATRAGRAPGRSSGWAPPNWWQQFEQLNTRDFTVKSLLWTWNAPIPASGIGTDTEVEYSTRTCKISADSAMQVPVEFILVLAISRYLTIQFDSEGHHAINRN